MSQQLVAVHAQEADRREIGKLQVGFAAGFARLSERGGSFSMKQCERGGKQLGRVLACTDDSRRRAASQVCI